MSERDREMPPEPGAAEGDRVENTPGSAGDVVETSYPEGARDRVPEETWLGDEMHSRRQADEEGEGRPEPK